MHSDQFKPKSDFKLLKKYIFSEGEQFPLIFILHSDQFNPKSYLNLIKKHIISEGEQLLIAYGVPNLSTNGPAILEI